MEERGLVGLEARTADGAEIGRISEVVTDEESGEVTHVIVESEEERVEVPISALTLDPEEDFAIFHADRSDVEPGDHTGDEVGSELEDQDYAPTESDEEEDQRHEGQLVTEPESEEEAQSEQDLVREDWEDETYTSDSGYPRNDAYVDPDSGEERTDPLLKDNVTLKDDIEDLLNGTNLSVRSAKDGVVELTGSASTEADLEENIGEIVGLDGVLEIDATDVSVG